MCEFLTFWGFSVPLKHNSTKKTAETCTSAPHLISDHLTPETVTFKWIDCMNNHELKQTVKAQTSFMQLPWNTFKHCIIVHNFHSSFKDITYQWSINHMVSKLRSFMCDFLPQLSLNPWWFRVSTTLTSYIRLDGFNWISQYFSENGEVGWYSAYSHQNTKTVWTALFTKLQTDKDSHD